MTSRTSRGLQRKVVFDPESKPSSYSVENLKEFIGAIDATLPKPRYLKLIDEELEELKLALRREELMRRALTGEYDMSDEELREKYGIKSDIVIPQIISPETVSDKLLIALTKSFTSAKEFRDALAEKRFELVSKLPGIRAVRLDVEKTVTFTSSGKRKAITKKMIEDLPTEDAVRAFLQKNTDPTNYNINALQAAGSRLKVSKLSTITGKGDEKKTALYNKIMGLASAPLVTERVETSKVADAKSNYKIVDESSLRAMSVNMLRQVAASLGLKNLKESKDVLVKKLAVHFGITLSGRNKEDMKAIIKEIDSNLSQGLMTDTQALRELQKYSADELDMISREDFKDLFVRIRQSFGWTKTVKDNKSSMIEKITGKTPSRSLSREMSSNIQMSKDACNKAPMTQVREVAKKYHIPIYGKTQPELCERIHRVHLAIFADNLLEKGFDLTEVLKQPSDKQLSEVRTKSKRMLGREISSLPEFLMEWMVARYTSIAYEIQPKYAYIVEDFLRNGVEPQSEQEADFLNEVFTELGGSWEYVSTNLIPSIKRGSFGNLQKSLPPFGKPGSSRLPSRESMTLPSGKPGSSRLPSRESMTLPSGNTQLNIRTPSRERLSMSMTLPSRNTQLNTSTLSERRKPITTVTSTTFNNGTTRTVSRTSPVDLNLSNISYRSEGESVEEDIEVEDTVF